MMKVYEHPEVVDINNTCDISPQTQYTSDVCELVKGNKVILLKTETIRIKNDRELDQALKETFPASDAIAKYL
jgi:hypothetical protein